MTDAADTNAPTKYLGISYARLIICMLVTFGFYDVYWSYKNWVAIKDATGRKIWPFWRAVFSIFWVYALFGQIGTSAKAAGYRPRFSAKLLAIAYIVACVVPAIISQPISTLWVVIAMIAITLLVDTWSLVMTQKAINHYSDTNKLPRHKTTKGEIAIIIVGVIICILNVVFILQPPNTERTPKQQALYEKYNKLTADYDSCSTSLDMRHESLDTNDQKAMQAFAADEKKCDTIRDKQNKATDEYNASLSN